MNFRNATKSDVPTIIELLADDKLGSKREKAKGESLDPYYSAFLEIESDKNNELIIVEFENEVVGTFQLTFIPSLTRQGRKRAQIEGVRVKSSRRGTGVGRKMFEWAIQRSKEVGCKMAQLTSDKKRPEAHKFYSSLGFQPTHEGYKLVL